jgi:Kef-type K+ transport system membrane component KefB
MFVFNYARAFLIVLILGSTIFFFDFFRWHIKHRQWPESQEMMLMIITMAVLLLVWIQMDGYDVQVIPTTTK